VLRQSLNVPCVEVRRAATTVTSCAACPLEAIRLAMFPAHAAEPADPPPGAEIASQTATSAGSATHLIGLQTTWR
jgi:hypothetical protein